MNFSGRKNHLDEEREYHSPSSGIFFDVKKRLFNGTSPYQKIEVFENEAFGNVLFLDGLVQTSEKDEYFYHEMIVHPAIMSHPSPKACLIIGGGDGGTLKEALKYPVEQICLVEIDKLVIEICQEYFPWLDIALKDPRAQLVIADGSAFVEKAENKFDVIIIDSSEPLGPSSVLYGKEFYEKLKRSLNPGGIVAAQIGSPLFHLEILKRMSGMLRGLFPVVRFYWGPVPTYPGGTWSYVFLSEESLPSARESEPPQGLKYYTPDIHRAAFALPGFLKTFLDQ